MAEPIRPRPRIVTEVMRPAWVGPGNATSADRACRPCGSVMIGSMALTPWNAFLEVCRTGSIRAAAEATGFTQPGLSRQVAALEREVGVRLLDRGPRGVTPTAAGAALLPHARLVVNEARRGRDAARAATDRPAALIIGAVPSATASLVPRALGELRTRGGPECTVISRITPELGPMV